MIDILAPYLPFMIQVIVIIANLIFIFKSINSSSGLSVLSIVVFNMIIKIIITAIVLLEPKLDGLIQYDLISMLFRLIIDFIKGFGSDLWNLIF